MITDLKVIKFRGSLYAVINDRDDYTANDRVVLRNIREIESHHYIKHNGELMNVDDEICSYYLQEEFNNKAHKWYKETKF